MTEASADRRAGPVWIRLAGVLLSPRETFTRVVTDPRWLDMLAVVTLVAAACRVVFLSTDVGQQALIDQQVSSLESFGLTVSDEQYDALVETTERYGALQAGFVLVTVPVVTLVVAGVLFVVFSAGFGGEATFRQMFAVVTHAGAVTVAQQLFVTPLNYARESMSSPANLAVFFPMLDEGSFPARFLGTIDLFIVWWIVVLAIGLGVLYRRRTRPIAVALLAIYAGLALIIAAIVSVLGGT